MVEVEARIDVHCRNGNVIPHVAVKDPSAGCAEGGRPGKLPCRGECERLLHEGIVSAVLGTLVDVIHEGIVEIEQCAVCVDELHRGRLLQNTAHADTGIIDLNTLHVVVGCVVLIQEVASNIRNVHACITFPGEVDLVALHVESVDKVLPKPGEVLCHIVLVPDKSWCSWCCRRQASANGLVNPDHIGEIGPRKWIWLWRVCTRLPEPRTVFLHQAIHRAAAWSSIEPDGDLITRERVVGWKEPEKELVESGAIRGGVGGRDGQSASIRLAYIKVHQRYTRSIDDEF